MQDFWIGISIGAGGALLTSAILLFFGFLKTVFALPSLVQSIRNGVECLLDGQIKHTRVTSRVIEVQQASLEFIRDHRDNGNITSALSENASAKEDCEDILDATQRFLVSEFSGGK